MWGRIPKGEDLEALIFNIKTEDEFLAVALAVFQFQYGHNKIYQTYCNYIGCQVHNVQRVAQIPFLPISFFKTAKVTTTAFEPRAVFESSGTTGTVNSRHYVKNLSLYRRSFIRSFEIVYGSLKDYAILGLLPSYLERQNSSLVYMVKEWMEFSGHPLNGFYLDDYESLNNTIATLKAREQKTLLIGVTYALLDFAALYPQSLSNVIVMETGGMKGRKKEQTREEVHLALAAAFRLPVVHSEYGMTELLSQAYAAANGKFVAPAWMKIILRPEDDPLTVCSPTEVATGVVNIIDLANIWSCSFIATDDVGRLYGDGSFKILGRMDNSDIRGCSLMVI